MSNSGGAPARCADCPGRSAIHIEFAIAREGSLASVPGADGGERGALAPSICAEKHSRADDHRR